MKYDEKFNDDERMILNHLGNNKDKDGCIQDIEMGILVTNNGDVKLAMKSLLDKVISLSNSEWEDMQGYFPLSTSLNDDDVEQVDLDSAM